MEKAISYIIKRILCGAKDLNALKREACIKFGIKQPGKNTLILQHFPKEKLTKKIMHLLKRKPMRTLSGVAPVAVMVKPQNSCKWGCIYCSYTGNAPKSYTGSEPAALRAINNNFDAFKQVKTRIKQFELNGHFAEKCDVIIMGGTFLQMNKKYKINFIKRVYDALNGKKSKTLDEAKTLNERAAHRMVGLTIETRPDVCGKKEINEMLDYGTTRVELGVQHPSNQIYKKINRGHTVLDVINATKLLKDSAFKVCYHLMPGLPGSDPQKDIGMFKKIFSDEKFRPDMLKIYPTLVMPNTKLYSLMQTKKYEPCNTETTVKIILEAYKYIPRYVRIMRIQRDIPANLIAEGVKKSNLREIVEKKAVKLGIKINEIRYREAGLNAKKINEPVIKRFEYNASKGKEIFLSVEDKKSCALAGFLRLRMPAKSHRKEITEKTALVRELHIYGAETPLDKKGIIQHKGFGSALLEEAEKISKEEFDKDKIIINSGIGVKPYYYKRGYCCLGPYVSKFR